MAGNYANVPSWRMAHDRDGTQWFTERVGIVTQLTSAVATSLNNEASDGAVSFNQGGGWQICAIFPELRDIDAYFFCVDRNTSYVLPQAIEVSTNTTNVLDGTWTSLGTPNDSPNIAPKPAYREQIRSITALGQRAIRFRYNDANLFGMTVKNIHLYGEPIPGANPNRLALWHPTLDQRIVPSHFDWGDVPRSSSADKQFRVKNLSSTLTANSIRVAQEVLTDATPSVPGQHTLSTDGTTFLAQVNVGNLAPGALSGVVTLRRNTPSNAQLQLWAHRVFAEANSWS